MRHRNLVSAESMEKDWKHILLEAEVQCKENHRVKSPESAHKSAHYDLFQKQSPLCDMNDVCWFCATANPSKYPSYRLCVECGKGGSFTSKGFYTCTACAAAYCNGVCLEKHRQNGCFSLSS